MRNKDRIVFQKINDYIKDIQQYSEYMSLDDFRKDKKTINACAFLIGQIGELSKSISDEALSETPNIPWRNVKGMRNKIVHDYENVDISILWGTIKEGLPTLSDNLNKVLNKEVKSALDENNNKSLLGNLKEKQAEIRNQNVEKSKKKEHNEL